ncbi:hypothetical protein [Couchioplanes azureus]|uniref:hypothetical protein n=1 Tax=Couchioplanes caeruleus TaxID=56438 RepID=UPI0019B2572C|nr:hypothetical protein [Couchioplanes caeruleus]GGQ54060.1 hypothetical protein GCM10010166_23680 [Couchioplanes caeruleus subsp. azureus]
MTAGEQEPQAQGAEAQGPHGQGPDGAGPREQGAAAGDGVPLTGWLWLTGGLLGLVLGVLWTAQGLDLVHDSVLSGVSALAVLGPVVAVAGLALMVTGVRVRARFKQRLAAQRDGAGS